MTEPKYKHIVERKSPASKFYVVKKGEMGPLGILRHTLEIVSNDLSRAGADSLCRELNEALANRSKKQ